MIEDIGVSTLIIYLPSLFPNMKGVCFDYNMVSRDMRQKLYDILNQVNEIQIFILINIVLCAQYSICTFQTEIFLSYVF